MKGISPKEGVEAFARVLCRRISQLAVSTEDFQARIERANESVAPSHPLSASAYSRPQLSNAYVPPRNETERFIVKIWREVLGIQQVGIHDNFFDLGGNSLLAIRLFAQIRNLTDENLPLATLFQAPTIEQLADLLRSKEWSPSWSSLVAIQPNGSKPPFFCVHAHGGNVLNFNGLARHLGTDQPFYGLQAQGLDGTQARQSSIEEMAAHYVKEIRSVQPDGPYLLGGNCFGGMVAFEMAQQLRAQSQEVSLLALIDCFAPGYPKSLPWIQRRVAQVKFHWRNLEKLELGKKLDYIKEKGKIARARVGTIVKKVAAKVYLSLGLSVPPTLQDLPKKRPRLTERYSPKVYPGRVTVFSPSERNLDYTYCYYIEPHMGWNGLAAGGLDAYQTPGKSTTMFSEPSVKSLAEQLKACIDRAIANNKQPLNKYGAGNLRDGAGFSPACSNRACRIEGLSGGDPSAHPV